MPTLNRPLIEAIITQLIDHPEQHAQRHFGVRQACGTTHCVAGWAIVLSGQPHIWIDYGRIQFIGVPGGDRVEAVAARILGLDAVSADNLFYDFGDTDHIVGRLKDLLNDAPAGAETHELVSA